MLACSCVEASDLAEAAIVASSGLQAGLSVQAQHWGLQVAP